MNLYGTLHDDRPNMTPSLWSRRTLFQWATKAALGVIGMGLALPLIGYVVSPALKRREPFWAEVGPTDQLRMNEPEELEYASTVKDGWRTGTVKRRVGRQATKWSQQARQRSESFYSRQVYMDAVVMLGIFFDERFGQFSLESQERIASRSTRWGIRGPEDRSSVSRARMSQEREAMSLPGEYYKPLHEEDRR